MKHVEEKTNQTEPPATFALKFPLTFSAPALDSDGTVDEAESNPHEKENSK